MRVISIISFLLILIISLVVTCLICFKVFNKSPKCYSVCECTDQSVYCEQRGLNVIPNITNEKLTALELSGNNIEVIDNDVFNQCVNVVRINLNDNRISRISSKAYHGPRNLQILLLSNNELQYLPDDIFDDHVDSLKVIDLSNNRLTALPISLEKMTKLTAIYLLGNPLHCGCEMRFLASNLRNMRIIEAKARCESPTELQNKNLRDIYACSKESGTSQSLPLIINKPQDIQVSKGHEARFDCQVSNLNDTEIQWLYSFKDDNVHYYWRNQTLIIPEITNIHDYGTITCIATNNKGSTRVSAKILLNNEESINDTKVSDEIKLNKNVHANLSDPCEMGKIRFDKTLNNARKLINSVVNETTETHEIQSLLRRPNKAAKVLAKLNDEREKIIELFNEIDQTCKASSGHFDKSSYKSLSLSPGQLAIFSQAFGCQGSVNSVPCSDRMCFHRKYRSFDGKCNNLKNPNVGSAVSPFHRLLKPEYENKLFTPIGWDVERVYYGFPKPSARLVSSKLLRANKIKQDPNLSVMVMQWGQFLDHDLDFTPVDPAFSRSGGGLACNDTCTNDPPCFPILVPPGDKRIKRPCIGFARSLATCGSGVTSLTSGFQYREQVNQITSFIDASNVYGSTTEEANNLRNRTYEEGKLRVGMVTASGKHLLPFNVNGMIDCQKDFAMRHVECFKAGDHRSNENLGLLSMHTIWVREHNRLAEELKLINNHWDEDKIYFEARNIVGALMQKITYKDWLPIVLGDGIKKLGTYQGYDDSVDPTVSNVFATAAMRFGHTLINPLIYRLDENFEEIPEKHLPLHQAFFAPLKMLEDGGIDPILRGLFGKGSKTVVPEQPMNTELIEKLFKMAHEIGLDLGSLNIQRGRDHALPNYNSWREFCGLKKGEIFDDFSQEIQSEELREKMREVYGHPGNIDLFAGAILEKKIPTSVVGPTFNCLLANQFKRTRNGDRFYFENPGQFNEQQLEQLNKGSLARIVCDNGDNITRVQKDIFRLPQSKAEFINCANIPKIDLVHWKDCKKSTDSKSYSLLGNLEDECKENKESYDKLELCSKL